MAVPQEGLSYQAADQARLLSLTKVVPVEWSQVVVVYLPLRGFNLVPSLNHHLHVPQGREVVMMMHSGALSSCQLVQGKGKCD